MGMGSLHIMRIVNMGFFFLILTVTICFFFYIFFPFLRMGLIKWSGDWYSSFFFSLETFVFSFIICFLLVYFTKDKITKLAIM